MAIVSFSRHPLYFDEIPYRLSIHTAGHRYQIQSWVCLNAGSLWNCRKT